MFSFNKVYNFFKKFVNGFLQKTKKISNKRVKEVKSFNKGMVSYLINDPNYPDLLVRVDDPKPNGLNIIVQYYIGSTEGFSSPQAKAANVYGLLCHGINTFQKKTNLRKWAAVNTLNVEPIAGNQPNAFYDRKNLKFFQFTKNNKQVFTCLSSDIVSHELGHAILDALRPDLFSVASIETWAFHEAFGDFSAMICTLNHDSIIEYALKETGNDLRKPNIISRLAEEMGKALGYPASLRDACNEFKYVKPQTLPERVPRDGLANEPHSFSRILSGVFYDVLVEIYEKYGKTKESLVLARDYLFETVIDTCILTPNCANFFESFCKTWLSVDAKRAVNFQDILNKVFEKRNIFQLHAMSVSVEEKKYEKTLGVAFTVNDMDIKRYSLSLPVSEIMPEMVNAMSSEVIGNLKVQLPVDEMYIQDSNDHVYNMCYGVNEAIEASKALLKYIFDQNLFGDGEMQSWTKDADNNLIRKHFSCDCYINNSTVPGNPEYGKGYKPKNNSGCCSYGSCANREIPEGTKVEKTCNLRYHSSCRSVNYNGKC